MDTLSYVIFFALSSSAMVSWFSVKRITATYLMKQPLKKVDGTYLRIQPERNLDYVIQCSPPRCF